MHSTRHAGGRFVATLALVGVAVVGVSVLGACDASEDTARNDTAMEEELLPGAPIGATAEEHRGSTPNLGRVSLQTEDGAIELPYEMVDGVPIAEGDVVVPVGTTAATRIGRRWADGVVPFVLASDLPEASRATAAIAHWQERTNLRFVPRTTQTDYVSFRPGSGCTSFIGRLGGQQAIALTTGETASNVVAVAIDSASDRVHYFYRRGFATVGTTSRANAHQAHFKYAIPSGKTAANLIGVGIGANAHLFAWYTDGTVSEGTPSDLAKYAQPAPYALSPGKLPSDALAFAIDTAGVAHAFYSDGTFSVGTPKSLSSPPRPFVVASGKSIVSLSHVAVEAGGTFVAFYSDGSTSRGTAAQLGVASVGPRVSYPGNCSVGSTIHEVGHAVGLFHEQTRHDRDAFVTIHWSNISSGNAHNFEKYAAPTGNDTGVYDFASIMHYDSHAFSANGQPTIVRLGGGAIVANRAALSSGDVAAAQFMYPQPPANP